MPTSPRNSPCPHRIGKSGWRPITKLPLPAGSRARGRRGSESPSMEGLLGLVISLTPSCFLPGLLGDIQRAEEPDGVSNEVPFRPGK